MPKEILIYLLILFDLLILVLLVFLYFKFKKLLNIPFEELEESLVRAHELVERLKELKKGEGKVVGNSVFDPKEEVYQLYKKGFKIKEIAKKTGLTEGEIELLLKTKQLKE
ncbi:MAG: hypothetical protein ACK4UR_03260 [Caldimicrobium sp.]